jgi:hypothetical protein
MLAEGTGFALFMFVCGDLFLVDTRLGLQPNIFFQEFSGFAENL